MNYNIEVIRVLNVTDGDNCLLLYIGYTYIAYPFHAYTNNRIAQKDLAPGAG